MNKLYIQKVRAWKQSSNEDTDALVALKAEFDRRAARRMTVLGMMLSHTLRDLEIHSKSSLVYATTYSETCAIEKYLASFPYPSPQGFQTSIHPSGVEQFLIQNKQAIEEYFPLAGGSDIFIRGLETLLNCQNESLIYCGGEERGGWLREIEMSSLRNYAWALQLSCDSKDRLGQITWAADGEFTGDFAIQAIFESLVSKKPFFYENVAGGFLKIDWNGPHDALA